MAKRRELKNIACGIISSFNSRNNDVDGYWGIGKLYKFSISKSTDTVMMDLLNKTTSPQTGEFDLLLSHYYDMLLNQVSSRRLTMDWIVKATITVSFDQEYQKIHHYWGSAIGKPCICKCEIIDDNGRIHSGVIGNNCRPHDPKREQRSARAGDY